MCADGCQVQAVALRHEPHVMLDCLTVELDVVAGEQVATTAVAVVTTSVFVVPVVCSASEGAEEARAVMWKR